MNERDFKCYECGHICKESEVLTGPSPFDSDDVLIGCPECKSIDSFRSLCDEKGCLAESTSGLPTNDGYKRLCGYHYIELSNIKAGIL